MLDKINDTTKIDANTKIDASSSEKIDFQDVLTETMKQNSTAKISNPSQKTDAGN